MAEPQLRPEELDRLEDALEDLELGELIDDPSPTVRAKLADYREILIASREAMPMQDVPPGLLAGVLAEARASTDDELLELDVAANRPQPESWWARVRKSFLIPTLAVVGTAALILIIVQPTMRGDSATSAESEVVARAEPNAAAEAELDGAPPPAPPAPVEEGREPDDAEGEELYEIATSRRSGTVTPQGVEEKLPTTPEPAAVVGSKADANGDAPAGGEAQKAGDPAASWDAIERGDKARDNGDCFNASREYSRAADDGNDSVRARALAGLGLCAAKEGNDAKAKALFDEARALDPDVGGYIATQNADAPSKPKAKPSPRKKRRSRSKKAAPSEYDQALPGNARNANPFKD